VWRRFPFSPQRHIDSDEDEPERAWKHSDEAIKELQLDGGNVNAKGTRRDKAKGTHPN
jgi:hypothetical protein